MNDIDKIVQNVIKSVQSETRVTLDGAKKLAEKVFARAQNQGKKVVIAVVNEQGRPVLVEVMDGAFLVSFDVALKKAYTAVAVKASTVALVKEVREGGSLEGLQREQSLLILAGGEPIYKNGVLIGGVGVSGGTADEDGAFARFAAENY